MVYHNEYRAEIEEYQEHMREQSKIIDEYFDDLAYHRSMKSIAVKVARESERDTQDYIERNYQRIMSERGIDENDARSLAKSLWIRGL